MRSVTEGGYLEVGARGRGLQRLKVVNSKKRGHINADGGFTFDTRLRSEEELTPYLEYQLDDTMVEMLTRRTVLVRV